MFFSSHRPVLQKRIATLPKKENTENIDNMHIEWSGMPTYAFVGERKRKKSCPVLDPKIKKTKQKFQDMIMQMQSTNTN